MNSPRTQWTAVELAVDDSAEDVLSDLLAMVGGDVNVHGAHETLGGAPGSWTVYVDDAAAAEQLRKALTDAAALLEVDVPTIVRVYEQQRESWHTSWREHFHPVEITDRLIISPPWKRDDPEFLLGDRHVVWIDPGMAFGTGTHATTRLCLRLADRALGGAPDLTLLDIGTGSGILGLSALALGARRVVGTDLDPEVRDNVADNLVLNSVDADRFTLHVGTLDELPQELRGPFDIILCNMLSHEFGPLLGDLPTFLKPGGLLVLSGWLWTERSEVLDALGAGWDVEHEASDEEWGGLVARRKL